MATTAGPHSRIPVANEQEQFLAELPRPRAKQVTFTVVRQRAGAARGERQRGMRVTGREEVAHGILGIATLAGDDARDNRAEIDESLLHDQATGLDAGDVEEVVDQVHEPGGEAPSD